MSKPTDKELARLQAIAKDNSPYGPDAEEYHIIYDKLLEVKLRQLDREWIRAMRKEYKDSDLGRWYG